MARREKKKFSKQELIDLEKLAGIGLSKYQLADYFGFCRQYFMKLLKNDDKVRATVERGRSRGIAQVAKSLFAKAIEGDTSCMIFFLKTQAHWSETAEDIKEDEKYKAPLSLVRQG